MAKNITRIVLTGGPAAGKTTLISRIFKEFKTEDGWKIITIPETATDLIAGFGIRPFGNCISMELFQYFVVSDQLHKEKMALAGAELVPEDKILIIYDRAVMDDKAYVSDEDFKKTVEHFGKTEEEILAGYDAVLHLTTCAKGAEYAYNLGNAARSESIEEARHLDDLTLRAWSRHPARYIIDNSEDFEAKIDRAIAQIYRILGEPAPEQRKRKYLVKMPDCDLLEKARDVQPIDMMQTYLLSSEPGLERRVRQQRSNGVPMYFYTQKRVAADGTPWVTERPISDKDYVAYLMESDLSLHSVRKRKYRFTYDGCRMELDIYPFCDDKAILFVCGGEAAPPPEIEVLKEVSGLPEYKNRALADKQIL